jgi:predicted DCC family thiol-disulfide oxidoreductase YuxK
MNDGPVLLYDGLCGFCNGTVQFVLPRDRRGVLRFATLQGDFARGVIDRHPELSGVDSLILVERDGAGERVFVRSEGALRVARHLGAPWSAAVALRVIPRFLRDALYNGFAKIRYRVFGKYDSCPLPSPDQRKRFLA